MASGSSSNFHSASERFAENPTTDSECDKKVLFRHPSLSLKRNLNLWPLIRGRPEVRNGDIVPVVHNVVYRHVKETDCCCFVGQSASCISIITWGFTLCQQPLRCSAALCMKLLGFTHGVLRKNIADFAYYLTFYKTHAVATRDASDTGINQSIHWGFTKKECPDNDLLS